MAHKSQEMKLSNFISLEWFGSGSNETKPHESEPSIHEWINNSTQNQKLNPDIKLKDGTIEVHGHNASLFYRNGKQIHEVISEFKKDFHEYDSIYKANKSALESFGKEQRSLSDALDHIANSETTFEQVRATILKYKDASKRYADNASMAHKFHEPSVHFLGEYKTGFLTKDHKYFETNQHVESNATVEVSALSSSDKDQAVKLAFDMAKLERACEDLDEKVGVCIDMTDSPLRGFSHEISNDRELMEILGPFIEHGMIEEDQNAGLLDVLMKRVENLNNAFWQYIKNSCH